MLSTLWSIEANFHEAGIRWIEHKEDCEPS